MIGLFGRRAPRPLTATGYTRTDLGVYIIGQDANGTLYGEDATSLDWVTSSDGVTWTPIGRKVTDDFGAGHRVIEVVFGGGYMWAVEVASTANGDPSGDAKVWRAVEGAWDGSWVNITPADQPVDTVGRPSILMWNGTHIFYANYGYYAPPHPARVWRATPTGAFELVMDVTGDNIRHVHAIHHDPTNAGHIYVTVGDIPGAPRGLYRSTTGGASGSFALVASNEYPIDFTFLANGDFVGDGDGQDRPHVVMLPAAEKSGGTFRSLIWPNTNPTDGGGSWKGTTRGIFEVDGALFYRTTAEGGAVGTRDGWWMAAGSPWRSVLLEEVPANPQETAAVGRIGKTYRVGDYLFNTRYRFTIPTLT